MPRKNINKYCKRICYELYFMKKIKLNENERIEDKEVFKNIERYYE